MDILVTILQPIAQLLDVSVGTLAVAVIGLGVLVVIWTVLRIIFKIAAKVFATGCLVLLLLGIAAFVGLAIMGAATPGTISF